jgi:4,5-DOPA dioxygenase extradiol
MNAVWKGEFPAALAADAKAHPKPNAVVVFSAHWLTSNTIEITSAERPEQIFDFYGFPDELYEVTYEPPGAPKFAERLRRLFLIADFQAKLNPARGLDHGAWIPLALMYPDADVPVVQVSLPMSLGYQELVRMGRALIELRSENLMFVGSGNLVHNLAAMNWPMRAAPPFSWARRFDDWAMERIVNEPEEFANQFFNGPNFREAHPSVDHLLPLFPLLGLRRLEENPHEIFRGFEHGSLSMRTFDWVIGGMQPSRAH